MVYSYSYVISFTQDECLSILGGGVKLARCADVDRSTQGWEATRYVPRQNMLFWSCEEHQWGEGICHMMKMTFTTLLNGERYFHSLI